MSVEFAPDVFRPLGEQVAGDAELWTDPNGRKLSDRVWLAGEDTRRQIDKRLRLAIARGDGPVSVARDLEQFLDPSLAPVRDEKTGRLQRYKRDARGRIQRDESGRPIPAQPKGAITRTPSGGGGSYPARRLARSEITRAFGMATKDAVGLNPFALGVQWNLSHRYDAKRDQGICAKNASGHSRGLPRGVYRVDELPPYPAHPQEMCPLSPYADPDTDAIIAELRREFGISEGNLPGERAPVGDALDLPPLLGQIAQTLRGATNVRAVAQSALRAIDAVHVDGALPEIPILIEFDSSSTAAARFRFMKSGEPRGIVVNASPKFANVAPDSFVHEVGHFLDFSGIGKPGAFSSQSDPIMAGWADAVRATRAVKELAVQRASGLRLVRGPDGAMRPFPADKKHLGYLLDAHELWARSYAQYIATRSGDAALRRSIEATKRRSDYAEQWEDDDFAPVAKAIDELFRTLGWRA